MEVWKRFNEKEVSHSMAHYLQAVAGLKRAKGYARVGDIADELGVSKSGVTSMLRSLRARGLVDHERYGCVELTPVGQELADRTETNRAVLSLFFRDILGVSDGIAREDACMIEHLVSPEAMARLLRLTTLLQSTEPAAVTFRKALHNQFDLCAEHCGECGFCRGDTCLLEPYDKEAAEKEASAGGDS